MDPTTRLELAAAKRHGVITRHDARAAGLSSRQIRIRIDSGRWQRHSRDVFLVAAAPPTPCQELMAASLRHGAAAAFESAAWLIGIQESPPSRPSVARTSPRGAHDSRTWVHRLADLERRDLATVDSIRTTNATRTLVDLAGVLDDDGLRILIDRACRKGLTHRLALESRLGTARRYGQPGVARARRVLAALHEESASVESELESLLLRTLIDAGLPCPTPQHLLRAGGRRYRLDFAYPEHRIAIEGDGFAFHSDRDRFESDRTRQNDLVLAGWLVLRFTWRQLVHEPERVAARVAAALALRTGTSAAM